MSLVRLADRRVPRSGRPSLREVRGWSDRKLLNAFFYDRTNRSLYERVIGEHMIEDGYADFADWIWPKEADKSTAKSSEGSLLPKTASGQTLGSELRAILDSGCKFENTYDPERCVEFCSPAGNLYDKTEDELTRRQANMLGLVRDRARRELRKRS